MGLWIGVFWLGIGLFFLISEWMGQAAFHIPKTSISGGWIVVALGVWRVWWWWMSVEKPRRRRLTFEADRRDMELEMSQDMAALQAELETEAEADTEHKS